MDSDSSQYLLFVILLACSAFFSMSETALMSISKIRLRNMIDDGVKNARLVEKVLDNPGKLLSAILIGNNLVNIGATALSTGIATNLFGSKGVGIATGVVTILVLIFGEVTPKTFAKENYEKVAITVIKPIYFCVLVMTPLVIILNFITGSLLKLLGVKAKDDAPLVTESELLTMVDVSHEEGVLQVTEKEMITNVVDFGNIDAETVMVPRTEMVAVPVEYTYSEVVAVFREKQFTRLPVYAETNDNIVGVLSFKDIMLLENTDNFKISDYMKEPYFTYESKPCSQLLTIMRNNCIPLAIVLDEYGGTAGIITIQDMIREIVGNFVDENVEDVEEIKTVSENEFLVDATTRLDDVNDVLGIALESENSETIGGYVLGLFNRFPQMGEEIKEDNIVYKVEEFYKNRIVMLRITLLKSEEMKEN